MKWKRGTILFFAVALPIAMYFVLAERASWRPRTLQAPQQDIITKIRFSPDGQYLSAATEQGSVLRWNVKERHVIQLRAASTNHRPAYSVDFSSNGKLFAGTPATGDTVQVWDLATGRNIAGVTVGFSDSGPQTNRTAFSPDSNFIASTSDIDPFDGQLTIALTQTDEKVVKKINFKNCHLGQIEFSPDGRYLLANSSRGSISILRLIDISKMESAGNYLVSSMTATSFSISPNSKQVALVMASDVYIHSFPQGHLLHHIKNLRNANLLCYSPDNKYLAIARDDNHVSIYSTKSWKAERTIPVFNKAYVLAFSPNSQDLAIGTAHGRVTLWRIK
jgi:WD40 repeat protein